MAYYSIEPFGEWRGDLRAGIVASTIANSNRGKNQRTYSPQDFMIDFEPRPRKTSKELYSMFRAWAESA